MKKARVSAGACLFLSLLVLLLAGSGRSAAQSPSFSQLAELTDTPPIQFEETGTSVAISGNVAVVGANNESTQTGAAYVFVKPTTGWANMTQTATLTASDGVAGDGFGQAVAISGDTILVAAQNTSTVYLYVKPASGWTHMTQTAKLTVSVPTSRFGLGLAISGNTVVIGAYGTNQEGTAYVYVKPSSGWVDTQQTGELLATDKGDFGLAVGVSGNTIVVGAPTALSQDGVVYVYTKPSGGWMNVQPIAMLTTAVNYAGGNFGGSLSISGNTVIVGAFLANSQRTGEAYIFVKPQSRWTSMTETVHLNPPSGAQYFGLSVSISGNTAVVGAPTSMQSGAAYVFLKPKSGWTTISHANADLQASDGANEDYFGNAVSVSSSTVLAGAFQHNLLYGAAYIFLAANNSPNWQEQTPNE
jgi:FG-GAP repeat